MGGHLTPSDLVKVNVLGRVEVCRKVDRDVYAVLGRKGTDFAPEAAGRGVMPVDGRLYTLWARQVGGISSSVVHWVSTGGVFLGPNEPCVAHLLPMVSVAAVVARILFRLFLFPFPRVSPAWPPPQP